MLPLWPVLTGSTDTQRSARIPLFTAGRTSLRASVGVGWARALLGAGAVVVVGRLIDRAASGEDVGGLVVALAVLLLARALLAPVQPLTGAATSTRVAADLRRRVIDVVLTVGPWAASPKTPLPGSAGTPPNASLGGETPAHWVERRRTGELVAKATEGIDAAGDLAGTFLPQLIAGMSVPLLLAVVVATIDLPTAVVLVLILPVSPLLLRLLEQRFASVSTRYRQKTDQLAARFLDGIQGMKTLKALDRADAYGDEIAEDAERIRVETMGLLRVNQLALLAVDTLFTLGTVVAAAGMAGWRLTTGAITVGEGVAIVLLGVLLIEPLTQIGRFFYVGAIGRSAATQIRELLSLDSARPSSSPVGEALRGVVEFDRVSFTYPDGTQAIWDMSFRIAAGERVALVGPSGAGKTTIAHLALGLLHPDQGVVRVGGRAVLVPQRPFLFHGTVADNLRLAKPDATEAELWEVLEAADLAAMVSERPAGLGTPVGERGLRLSGGEVQRLAIARALLVDAPVVVLDEPTSNVDLDSEARISAALNELTRDRTVLIIAHRRSTIAGVDRVLLIDEGHLTKTARPHEAGPLIVPTGTERGAP